MVEDPYHLRIWELLPRPVQKRHLANPLHFPIYVALPWHAYMPELVPLSLDVPCYEQYQNPKDLLDLRFEV